MIKITIIALGAAVGLAFFWLARDAFNAMKRKM